MRKEVKRLKCTLLNGSVWSTEKKYMRRYRGTFDIFFGIEHRKGKVKKWRKWQKQMMKKLKGEVEKKGLKLSVDENGKEGKS